MLYGARGETADADFDPTTMFALGWESSDRDEIWFVSYADLISVILAMVVLLFGRLALTSEAAAAATAFTGPPVEAVANVPADPAPHAAAALLAAESNSAASPGEVASETSAAAPPAETAAADGPAEGAPSREGRLAALIDQRFAGKIAAEPRGRDVVLTIADVALFDSARARLQDAARPLLAELAASLREAGDARISVGGHTDSVPVAGGEFDSNWDLAAARANAVTQYLLEQGFDPQRLQSVSYADTRPVADNATPPGRAANRRVEIQLEFVGGEAG